MFTAPHTGVYLITFSYRSDTDPGESNNVYMYEDGVRLLDTDLSSYYNRGGRGKVRSTGGRAVYKRLDAGSTIHLGTGAVKGNMGHIILCVEFINN